MGETSSARDIELGVADNGRPSSEECIVRLTRWMDAESRVCKANASSEEGLWEKASIYKVPPFARNLNRKAFTPQVVSFGPFHHGKGHLKLMEEAKKRALVKFLERAKKPFDEFASEVKGAIDVLQGSYYMLHERWKEDREAFLKLMITDGCFMLEILRLVRVDEGPRGYSDNDPVFGRHAIGQRLSYFRRDMLLIENQLPLILLKKLVTVDSPQKLQGDDYIHKLVLDFVSFGTPLPEKLVLRLHPLDLFRECWLQNSLPQTLPEKLDHKIPPRCSGEITISSATDLHDAGINIRRKKYKDRVGVSPRDVSFNKCCGILYIPQLTVDDATEFVLLNIIAFEHLHVKATTEVSSYVWLMDELIDSAGDVNLLHRHEILQNSFGSSEAVAALFNGISKDVSVEPDINIMRVRKKIYEYSHRRWNKWQANLCHTHFGSPWSALALAGALLVIVLTLMQTVYALLDYYRASPSPSPSPH